MKRVAFLGRGGHTLPTYRALLNRIALNYKLTLYFEVPIEPSWRDLPHVYELRAVSSRRLPRRLREILLLVALIIDHLEKPYDLVHAHSTYPTGFVAVIFQKIFNVPAIVSLHAAEASAFPDIPFGDLLSRRRARINRWIVKHAASVTALSNFQRREIEKNLNIVRPVRVIYRGVEMKKFYSKRVNGINAPVVLLSVGYLNAIKDPDTLLFAFSAIQRQLDSILIVVGKDYTNGEVRRTAEKLGLSDKVTFQGYVEHEKMDEFYREADVLLHTSRYESQGMVVAEAMASGVLVAGTDVGLLSDLAGECCVTVPTKDADALARSVLELLRNNERMTYLRENAYRWSRHHSLANSSEEVMALYRQLLTSS